MLDLFTPLPTRVHVRVTPKAASNRVHLTQNAEGQLVVRVYVTVAAEDGRANKAVLQILAKHWGLVPSRLVIERGHTTRDKIIAIRE
jgi:uncharacterized protein YggU (UPF0235/DUF167 family)